MYPHNFAVRILSLFLFFSIHQSSVVSQRRKIPPGGRVAVVVDERLAALRSAPRLTSQLVRRLSRGRLVAIRASRVAPDGTTFLLVNLSSRTHGWLQAEAILTASHPGDDAKLLRQIKASSEFDRIAKARIFLDNFPSSHLRAEVLLLLGDAAEEVSTKLTREALRRVNEREKLAPEFSYYLNYAGLDRYNRLGVTFIFDSGCHCLHYDGAAWRELIRRHQKTSEAAAARMRLAQLSGR